jgi:ABC-2 type transport system ATP-binding protein
MSDPIEINDLVKDFQGFRAVDSLQLQVHKGSFTGFLGPNGAGKTTTIKILTNLIRSTSGTALLNGVDVGRDPKMALSEVGAVVETPEFYPYLTPKETLEYLGKLRGMTSESITARTAEVLETVKMTEWTDKRIGKFSKGMKQRVALAQAIMHKPAIIILDEPTSGLDPRGMYEMREVLKELRKQQYTVFMSSHLLNEVQDVCTDVALINRGKLLRKGRVEDLLKEVTARRIEVRLARPLPQDTFARLAAFPGVGTIATPSTLELAFDFKGDDEKQADLLAALQGMGLRIASFKESGVALETLYMSLISDSR